MTRSASTTRAVVLLSLAIVAGTAALPAVSAAQPQRGADPAVTSPPHGANPQDEFVPVGTLPRQEQLPAAPLLLAAYAFVWVALFVYVWTIWSRMRKVERDLRDLSARVADRPRSGA